MESISKTAIARLGDLIAGASRPCIVTHTHPDGDAMGSSLAMRHFLLEKYSLDAPVLVDSRWPDAVGFLAADEPGGKVMVFCENSAAVRDILKKCDLVIGTDISGFDRCGNMERDLLKCKAKKVLIDHHLNPKKEQFDVIFSTTEVSSACELEYRILRAMPGIKCAEDLPAQTLRALCTGMTTDTNNFANSVFPGTLKMASELIAAGVDREDILNHVYNEHSEARLRLMSHFLAKMTITPEGVAYVVFSRSAFRRFGCTEDETEGFVNLPLAIANVRLSIFIRQEGRKKMRVSLRSKRGTSANAAAKAYFHGGGHEQASGGKLFIPADVKGVSDVPAYIEKFAKEFFKDNEI